MRKQRGFTLIELLVVVTIIALLIAILLPSLGRARDRAKIAACASNLKQMETAAALYATDWNAYYPPEYERGFQDYAEEFNGPIGSQMLMYAGTGTGAAGSITHYSGLATMLNAGVVSDGRIFFDPAIPLQIGGGQGPQKSGPINDAKNLLNGPPSGFTFNKHLGYFYQDHSDLNPTYQAEGTTLGKTPPNPPSVQPLIIPPATGPSTSFNGPSLGFASGLYFGAAYPKSSMTPPPNIFFISDLVIGPTAHGNGSGVNGGFFDGHVEYIDSGAFRKTYLNNSWDSNSTSFSNKLNTFEVQSMHQK